MTSITGTNSTRKKPRTITNEHFPTRALYDIISQLSTCEFTQDFSSIREILVQIEDRCTYYPEDAQFIEDFTGNLPLHLLVDLLDTTGLGSALRSSRYDFTLAQECGLGLKFLWNVLKVFPDAVMASNRQNLTPLHLGCLLDVNEWNVLYGVWCNYGCSVHDINKIVPVALPMEVVYLISQYSRGPKLIKCSRSGENLVHYMVSLRSKLEEKRWSDHLFADSDIFSRVDNMMTYDKRFIGKSNINDENIMHLLVTHNAPLKFRSSLIEKCIRLFPEMVTFRDKKGRTPLQLSMTKWSDSKEGKSDTIFLFSIISDRFPRFMLEVDHTGRNLLHQALSDSLILNKYWRPNLCCYGSSLFLWSFIPLCPAPMFSMLDKNERTPYTIAMQKWPGYDQIINEMFDFDQRG